MELQDLAPNLRVVGLLDEKSSVQIIAVNSRGPNDAQVYYRDESGHLGELMLDREQAKGLHIFSKGFRFPFTGDPKNLKLASEAYRISLAHLFDPYLSVHTSQVNPYPHQIAAVYKEMLPRMPLRYVLADDPGAGKTIMTGLLIKE